MTISISLYNTLTRKKDVFTPIDAANVRMYVCGPTVYDRPHLGNARSVVVYDVLYRLLKHIYGDAHVTYVRNITDVDDKINAAAKANGEPISALTARVEQWFHDDMNALGVLPPTKALNGKNSEKVIGCMGEPHATHHISHMIDLIEKLLTNGHAYESQGHVLFSVTSDTEYGVLSGRKLDELIAGARVEVESYKRHPGDFVLWKPAEEGDDASSVFESPWGKGRPGWHIECSAMSTTYLGGHFDIHGGGADLMFPHHENEIAQSRCALPGTKFANVWVHNGFLTVGGEKMSKSLGNFTTVKDVLDKGVPGEVIRLALLSAHYRSPLDWNEKLVTESKEMLDRFYRVLRDFSRSGAPQASLDEWARQNNVEGENDIGLLADDLNISKVKEMLNDYAVRANTEHNKGRGDAANKYRFKLKALGNAIGLLNADPAHYLKGFYSGTALSENVMADTGMQASVANPLIDELVAARITAKKARNWAEADRIRKELSDQGIILEDRPDGTTDWRRA